MLCAEGQRTLTRLQQRGLYLGYGCAPDYAPPANVEARLTTIYTHARQALYASLEESVLQAISPRYLRVRTQATSRDEYLAHPVAGEALCVGDVQRLAALYPTRRPQVQLVLSDGLNAHALHEHGRVVLPPLRQELGVLGCQVGAWDIVVDNGRVRAGYHIGELLQPEVVIHLIGERPGTGLHTLSAYCTYGRDFNGQWRRATRVQSERIGAAFDPSKPFGRGEQPPRASHVGEVGRGFAREHGVIGHAQLLRPLDFAVPVGAFHQPDGDVAAQTDQPVAHGERAFLVGLDREAEE